MVIDATLFYDLTTGVLIVTARVKQERMEKSNDANGERDSVAIHALQPVLFNCYNEFKRNFPYQGERLYTLIFERHQERIKIGKEKFAVRNLSKIFDATFRISSKTGFQAMTLRDLSSETGLSMGGLYSSISSKENIAIMVKDVVAVICSEIVDESRELQTSHEALEHLVRGYLYASTLMQHWFYFLYFETRSLPLADQEASKNIEIAQVDEMARRIAELGAVERGCHDAPFIATMSLSLIQERYLKPWKYHADEQTVDEYAIHCLELIYRATCIKRPAQDDVSIE